jgi:hypothetical protein
MHYSGELSSPDNREEKYKETIPAGKQAEYFQEKKMIPGGGIPGNPVRFITVFKREMHAWNPKPLRMNGEFH